MPGFLLFGKRLCSNRLKDWGIQVSITSLAVQHVSQWRFGYDFTLKHRARFKICYTHLEIERRYWRWLLGKETHLSNIWWLWVSMLNLRACWIQINSSLSSFNNHGHWKMGPRNRNEFRFLRKVPKGHVPLRQLFLRKKNWLLVGWHKLLFAVPELWHVSSCCSLLLTHCCNHPEQFKNSAIKIIKSILSSN